MQWESCTNSSVERFFKRFLIMQREGHRNPEMDQEPPGRMPDFGDTRGRNILSGMQPVVLSVRICKDDSLRRERLHGS